ncbi:MAG: SUMF1/EgtB/PvdO family nonheme iron enzyme [Polyangiaceae bacterium]|nr:SUMF1/EgtB/PvdO family nonheme iron enzyme [Polyangiaceae bacterium]
MKNVLPVDKLFLPEKTNELVVDLATSPSLSQANQTQSPLQKGCPREMVNVADAYCVDRYESSLVDHEKKRPLSPYYPSSREKTATLYETWLRKALASKGKQGPTTLVPLPPPFSLAVEFSPEAQSLPRRIPAGYQSAHSAALACSEAAKRLCSPAEWRRACRGQEDRKFPYGEQYRAGTCNVHRNEHPAALLHGDASKYHLDPRLNLTRAHDGPLLQATGESPGCASHWGDDAIYDMVGNLDEWLDEDQGQFAGGFYSRATKEGCDSSISVHGPGYRDYSLGIRCCKDIESKLSD